MSFNRMSIESEVEFLRKKVNQMQKLYDKYQWKKDDGDVLWWRFPNPQKPYIGMPTDENFPKDSTHWQRIVIPFEPNINSNAYKTL